MKTITAAEQNIIKTMKGIEVNGYKWLYYDNNLHIFRRNESKGHSIIKATTEDIHNGNIEFMTKHGLSR